MPIVLAIQTLQLFLVDGKARKAKGKDPLDEDKIRNAFSHQSLYVFYDKEALLKWLQQQPASIVLMMSSGILEVLIFIVWLIDSGVFQSLNDRSLRLAHVLPLIIGLTMIYQRKSL
jgi:hypothetical protein